MIAVRWATMAAVTLAILGALGATLSDVQPSAQRVLAAAVVALLAPLFWPGVAATPARTALRVTLWSAAAAALAAVAMWLFGAGAQPLARIAGTGAMLWLVLLAMHALAAMLEQRWLGQSPDAPGAREAAGRSAAVALSRAASVRSKRTRSLVQPPPASSAAAPASAAIVRRAIRCRRPRRGGRWLPVRRSARRYRRPASAGRSTG